MVVSRRKKNNKCFSPVVVVKVPIFIIFGFYDKDDGMVKRLRIFMDFVVFFSY